MSHWTDRAFVELGRAASVEGGWGYHPRSMPSIEPTALAVLALSTIEQRAIVASSSDQGLPNSLMEWTRHRVASLELIRRFQLPDGSVFPTSGVTETGWTTPYAVLAWSTATDYGACIERAKNWLLASEGVTFAKSSDSPLGHDTTIPGWNWVEGTHSWVEPTALAILALRRAGLSQHQRIHQGLALLIDRAIPEGGWNFGNNVVYGRSLRPKPAPTGLALLALAGSCDRIDQIEQGVQYLLGRLPGVRSPQSLGLGLLGLAAWDSYPAEADGWLEDSFENLAPAMRTSDRLAYLLLASTLRSLPLLGSVEVRAEVKR